MALVSHNELKPVNRTGADPFPCTFLLFLSHHWTSDYNEKLDTKLLLQVMYIRATLHEGRISNNI
jgi:hypothetical protein